MFTNDLIAATYFMTYHTIMKTSADYIDALRQAKRIAENITVSVDDHGERNQKVFPYRYQYCTLCLVGGTFGHV